MNKDITVKSAELKKEGETNGKTWKLFKIEDQDGDKYTSFDEDLAQIGKQVNIQFTEEQKTFTNSDGQEVTYTARTIKSVRSMGSMEKPTGLELKDSTTNQGNVIKEILVSPKLEGIEAVVVQLTRMEAKIDRLLHNALQGNNEPIKASSDPIDDFPDINPEDIPF